MHWIAPAQAEDYAKLLLQRHKDARSSKQRDYQTKDEQHTCALREARQCLGDDGVTERLAACPALRQCTRQTILYAGNNLFLGSGRNCAQDETNNAQYSDQD